MKVPAGLYSTLALTALTLLGSCKGKGDEKQAASDSTKQVSTQPQPGSPIRYDSSKRYIFLTFDDAPQPPGTINCKRIFHEQGVKATFFLVGLHAEIDRLRQRLVDSLRNSYPEFLIANHSYSHGFRDNYKTYYTHPDSAIGDLMRAQEQLKIPVKIIRLPGSNSWVGKGENKGPQSAKAVRDKLASMGYNVIGWDVEWRFKGGSVPVQGAQQLADEVNGKFDSENTNEPNTVVILAHDRMFGKQQYADSLTRFISILKQDPRNVFETIDHYPLVQQK